MIHLDNDYVARLWATRRVGFLLDEIRIHGETTELRDEATDLARKLWDSYPLHCLLDRRRRRSAQCADGRAFDAKHERGCRRRVGSVAKAWDGFKEKKEGDDAVANARSQNAFKFAEQSGASIDSGRGRIVCADSRSLLRPRARSRIASRNTRSNQSS